MLRPGLVALYNIRPGNGAGLFLQPRSPHGAKKGMKVVYSNQLPSFDSSRMVSLCNNSLTVTTHWFSLTVSLSIMWLKVTLSHSILQQQQQSNIHIKFKAMDVGSN